MIVQQILILLLRIVGINLIKKKKDACISAVKKKVIKLRIEKERDSESKNTNL